MTAYEHSAKAIKIILPLLILVLGIGGFLLMSKLKQPPKRQPPARQGVLVEVQELQPADHQVRVFATGSVRPARQIELVPQVGGKVSWISPRLVNGGFFETGETLLKIEDADYRLAIDHAKAEIARARVALATERERAKVALQEWQRVDLPDKGEPGPLVTRQIQQQQEEANLAAAQAALEQAQLNLQRTELKAPFPGRIRQEQVDLGQFLRAGTSVGNLVGTERAEIHRPVPVEELSWLKVPAPRSDQAGSRALIRAADQPEARWQGEIIRSLGEVDPTTRMATLVVGVEDPYAQQPPLEHGRFVEVELLGETLTEVISIPREALRDNGQVWLVGPDNRLQLRDVGVQRRQRQELLIGAGLAGGDRLVLTDLSGAAEGLLLRPVLREARP